MTPPAGARPGPPAPPVSRVATKAAVLRRLELEVTRRLDGLLSGDHLATTTGPGTEPAGARPYGPGDDARRIDWNLSARSLEPHVRTTEADRELETWLVVDRSPSLDFGTTQWEKREVALAAMAGFGFLGVRSGNRLGAVIAGGETLLQIPARAGRPHLLAALATTYDTPRRDGAPGPGADLAGALVRVERLQRRRGQLVVISDFLDRSAWGHAMRGLVLRHQVVGVHITDPRELTLPAVGLLGLVDPESGRRLHVQTNSARLRERFAAAAGQRRQDIRRTIIQAGAEYVELGTERDWLVDIARFMAHRRAARRQLKLGGVR